MHVRAASRMSASSGGWQGYESESIELDFDEFMCEHHRNEWVTDDDD